MNDLRIWQAISEDIQEICGLSKELTEYDRQFDSTISLNWNIEDYIKKSIHENFVVVAEKNDEIIGYLICSQGNIEDYRNNHILEIEELFVKDGFRSLGVGKRLINYALDWLKEAIKEQGITSDGIRVSVKVLAKNNRAIRFYREMGFVDYDLIMEMEIK
jgi:GNAT superfamily N-acetyltransferase